MKYPPKYASFAVAGLFSLTACDKPVDPQPALRAVAFLLFSAEDTPSSNYRISSSPQGSTLVLTQKENFAEGTEQLIISQKSPCQYEVQGKRGVFHKFYEVKYSFDFSKMRIDTAWQRTTPIPGFGFGNTLNAPQFVLPGVNVCTLNARADEYDFPQKGCYDHLQRQMSSRTESGRFVNAAKELANYCKVQRF